MTDDTWLNPEKEPAANEVAFDYVKSHDFRVVWADGAIGSITPQGLVHFALYAERPAIPRRQVFHIDQMTDGTGKLGREATDKQISRGSIVRELACDVMLNAQGAENLGNWLLEQAQQLKNIRQGGGS